MKLATTTGDFHGFCDTYLDRIRYVHEAGFKYIDLSMYTITESDELFCGNGWCDEVKRIKEYADENGICFVQAHSPDTNFYNGEQAYREAVDKTVRSIEICGMLGIKSTVVHSGYKVGNWDKELWFAENREFCKRLFYSMEKWNVNVLCENTTKANMNGGYFLLDGSDMSDFVKYVDHPLFHACWDTGHANIEGAQYDHIMAIGDDLYALHINDNRGVQDEHIIPYCGTVNMDEIMHALLDIGYNGAFTFEASALLRPNNCWLGARRSFDADTRLAEPRLFMQEQIEKFMYSVGEYILKSYNCFEE